MSTSELIAIIIAVISSSGLWAFIQFIFIRIDNKKQNNNIVENKLSELTKIVSELQENITITSKNNIARGEALLALSQDRIIQLSKQYLNHKSISIDEYSSLMKIVDSYNKLSNTDTDIINNLIEEVNKLPKIVN